MEQIFQNVNYNNENRNIKVPLTISYNPSTTLFKFTSICSPTTSDFANRSKPPKHRALTFRKHEKLVYRHHAGSSGKSPIKTFLNTARPDTHTEASSLATSKKKTLIEIVIDTTGLLLLLQPGRRARERGREKKRIEPARPLLENQINFSIRRLDRAALAANSCARRELCASQEGTRCRLCKGKALILR